MKKSIKRILSMAFVLIGILGAATVVMADPTISVVSGPSDDLNTHVFIVKNPSAESVDVSWDGGSTSIQPGASATVNIYSPGLASVQVFFKYTFASGATGTIPASSSNQYNLTVNYVSETGAALKSFTKVFKVGNATVTADSTIEAGGASYKLVSNASQTYSFNSGSPVLTFTYREIVPEPYNITVQLVNADNPSDVLQSASVLVNVNSTGSYTAPYEIEANGAKYRRHTGNDGVISHKYDSTASRTYTVKYEKLASAPDKPYNISVRYESAAGEYLDSFSVPVGVGQTATFNVASTYTMSDGRIFNRKAGETTQIVHEAFNTARLYTIVFNEDTSVPTKPYEIQIHYENAASGSLIRTERRTVNLNATVQFTAPATLTDGSGYTIAAGQERNITHQFGDKVTIYRIQYNANGGNAVTPYNITINYVNMVTYNKLYTTTVTIPVRGTGTHSAPASYVSGGVTYTFAAGQKQTIDHKFETGARIYNIFYAPPGVEPVAPEEDRVVIPEDTTTTDPVALPLAGAEDPLQNLDDPDVPLVNPPSSEDQTDEEDADAVTILDAEIPQGTLPLLSLKSGQAWWFLLLLIPAAGAAVYLVKRNKKKTDQN